MYSRKKKGSLASVKNCSIGAFDYYDPSVAPRAHPSHLFVRGADDGRGLQGAFDDDNGSAASRGRPPNLLTKDGPLWPYLFPRGTDDGRGLQVDPEINEWYQFAYEDRPSPFSRNNPWSSALTKTREDEEDEGDVTDRLDREKDADIAIKLREYRLEREKEEEETKALEDEEDEEDVYDRLDREKDAEIAKKLREYRLEREKEQEETKARAYRLEREKEQEETRAQRVTNAYRRLFLYEQGLHPSFTTRKWKKSEIDGERTMIQQEESDMFIRKFYGNSGE